jgi:hypothetical protein
VGRSHRIRDIEAGLALSISVGQNSHVLMKLGGRGGPAFQFLIPLGLYVALTTLWLSWSRSTPAFELAGFRVLNNRAGGLTVGRAVLRQVTFVAWAALSILIAPWLVIGPSVVWKTKSHSGAYDAIWGSQLGEKSESTVGDKTANVR